MENEEKNMVAQILQNWMEQYPPATKEDMFTLQLTSYEIAEILADFGTITPGDVTRELMQRGYELVRAGEGQLKWKIKRELEK